MLGHSTCEVLNSHQVSQRKFVSVVGVIGGETDGPGDEPAPRMVFVWGLAQYEDGCWYGVDAHPHFPLPPDPAAGAWNERGRRTD